MFINCNKYFLLILNIFLFKVFNLNSMVVGTQFTERSAGAPAGGLTISVENAEARARMDRLGLDPGVGSPLSPVATMSRVSAESLAAWLVSLRRIREADGPVRSGSPSLR